MSAEAVEEIRGGARGDAAAGLVAGEQYGVVARWQLRLCELSDDAIDRRRGRTLHPLYQGVFAVGHAALHRLALPTAAVLAAGPGARLSFHTAAWLYEFGRDPSGVIDVTHPVARAGRSGLRLHRGDPETHRLHGLPITSAARTVVDLATVLDRAATLALADRALMTDHLTPADLAAAIEPNRRHAALLRELLEDAGDLARARSRAEQRLLRAIRAAGLPLPEVNALVAGEEFDFVWRARRFILEYDGLRFHRTPARIANDARKQRIAHDAGFRLDRFTAGDLAGDGMLWLARRLQTWPSTTPGTPVFVE